MTIRASRKCSSEVAAITLLCLILGASSAAAERYVRTAVVVPAERLSSFELDDVLIASSGTTVFFLGDGGIGRFDGAHPEEGIHSIPLPETLATIIDETGFVLSSESESSVVVFHRKTRRAWTLEGENWVGPVLIGVPFFGATVSRGRIVLNTPESTESFRVIDGGSWSFGKRLTAGTPELDEASNYWLLRAGPRGFVAAAHRYLPRLRIYDGNLELVREVVEDQGGSLSGDVKVKPGLCCLELEVSAYAMTLAVSEDGVWVREGLGNTFSRWSWTGEPSESVVIRTPETPWRIAGAAVVGRRLYVRDRDGVVLYEPDDSAPREMEISIVDSDGEPIVGAFVSIHAEDGRNVELRADQSGKISPKVFSPIDAVRLNASAPGYVRTVVTDRLGAISRIVLEESPRLCVSVLHDGLPVKAFEVETRVVEQSDSVASSRTLSIHPISSVDGRGCLDIGVPFPLMILVKAEGFASVARRVENSDPVDVEMEIEAKAEVIVSDMDDNPVTGAELHLIPADDPVTGPRVLDDSQIERTDDLGFAKFLQFAPGDYLLVVEHPDFLSQKVAMTIPVDVPTKVELSAGARIEVFVRAAESDTPIEDVLVSARTIGRVTGKRLDCTTDQTGRCTIRAVPPGDVLVEASMDERAAAYELISLSGAANGAKVTLSLPEGVRLSGVVDGLDQYPRAVPTISLSVPGHPLANRIPVSGDGRFVVEAISPGRASIWVRDEKADRTLLYTTRTIDEKRSQFLHLRVPAPNVVSGRISKGENPCGDCGITAHSLGGGVATGHATRSDLLGRYELRLPDTGAHRFTITDPATGKSFSEVRSIEGTSHQDFEMPAKLTVVIVDEVSDPVADATVQVFTPDGVLISTETTAANGIAQIQRSANGSVRVSASKGNRSGFQVIRPNESGPVFIQVRGGGGKIRVVDSAGKLLESVNILASSNGMTRRFDRFISPDSEGFIETGVEPGTPLVVSAPGYAFRTVHRWSDRSTIFLVRPPRSFVVKVDEELLPCSIGLRNAGGRLAIRPDLPPVAVPFTSRDALFNGFEPGRYSIDLRLCSGTTVTQTFDIAPGLVTTVEFGVP